MDSEDVRRRAIAEIRAIQQDDSLSIAQQEAAISDALYDVREFERECMEQQGDWDGNLNDFGD